MALRLVQLPLITAVGTGGSTATGTQTSTRPFSGELRAIKVVQANSPHANTDITIGSSDGLTTQTILTLTNNNTASAWYYPRIAACDNAGAAILYAATFPIYVPFILDGYLTGLVAQGGSNATCQITVAYEDID